VNLSANTPHYLGAFLGGIGLSLTPCVYPLIPVIAGYLGISAANSKIKGLFLSLVFVTGLSITYSMLGLFASLTGSIFGTISANPLTHILVGIIIIFSGLAMFGILRLPLPNIIKPPVLKRQGYFSALILGLGFGLIISPCLTPALSSILFYLGTKRNLFYGVTLLLSFGYGMGLIFILAGAFSGMLFGLPKLGEWMVYIKRLYAIILIFMGLYFISSALKRL